MSSEGAPRAKEITSGIVAWTLATARFRVRAGRDPVAIAMAPRTASVVLVEDSPPYARLVALLLERAVGGGVDVRHHERLVDAVADLREHDADCVLLDLTLADAEGLEGLAALLDAGVTAPVIVLSGHDDDELALAAIAAGAQDYLVKGQERAPAAFVRAIRFAIARRRAQERNEDLLRAKEDRWRTLTHLAPVGILETDERGRCVFVNDWVGELTGRPPELLYGLAWRDGVHPDDRDAFDAAWQAAADGDGEFALEVRFVAPGDGAIRWVHVTAVLLRDPWDTPAGWLGTVVDVTPARQAREDLRAAESELRRQQEAVLAVSALAREASVADDPVALLCDGVRTLLRADEVVLDETSPPAPDAVPTRGVLEERVVGGGVLRVRWADGVDAPITRQLPVVQLVAAELGAALERRRLLDRLRDLARTDPLTGLANRRLWDERLDTELARAARTRRPLCVVALDLDHFKVYNDRHGHAAGDELLRTTTVAWRGVLRAADLLARLGGDEFALLLPDCGPASARAIVARLQETTHGEIGCSAGLAQWAPGEPAARALERADAALYRVKAAGRGGIGVADEPAPA
jgi:diguanylate cyclase (GGDEF)-like protein/PAS domain S-box-containing protein